MRIPKSIKEIPWPEPYHDEKHDFKVTVSWAVDNHEKLLIVTFQRNLDKRNWRTSVSPDFRLICSKKKPAAAILYQGERISKRKRVNQAVWDLGSHLGSGTVNISSKDKKALAKWLNYEKTRRGTILETLGDWVDTAMASEEQKEREARGELRDEDVRLCPDALPEGIVEHIRRNILPLDEVLIYKKGNVRGTCFLCREKVRANPGQRFRQHEVTACPNCGRHVYTYLETSDSFKVDYVQNLVSLQRGTDGKTVFLRQWHIKRDHTAQWNDIPGQLQEICRYAIRGNRVAKWQKENKENMYYVAYRYTYDRWTKVNSVPVVYDGDYYFYLPNDWREQVAGTSLQYCDIAEYITWDINYRRGRNPVRFLLDWVRYPAIEKFWKAGYHNLVHDRIAGLNKKTQHVIRWSKNSIGEAVRFPKHLLKIHAPEDWIMEDVATVKDLWEKVESGELKEADLPELARANASFDQIEGAMPYASVHKILKYIGGCVDREREQRKLEAEKARAEGRNYWNGGAFESPSIYRDYIADCIKLHLDLRDKTVLFPPDLDAAHARTIAQVKHEASRLSREAFANEVQQLAWMEWEKDGLMIRLPKDGGELTAEGAYLHHCVGGYVDRMANGKTTILLIRRAEEPDKPFYTLEWLNGNVQQCRTTHNYSYEKDPEVKAFVDEWVKKVATKGKKKKTKSKVA